MNIKRWLFALVLLIAGVVKAEDQDIRVDLREPVFADGVLSTQEGGVIRGAGLKLQARSIRFDQDVQKVRASGDLLLTYRGKVFVADSIEYDFRTGCGRLWNARTLFERWFACCRLIELYADGGYCLYDAHLTTCERLGSGWQVRAREVKVTADRYLCARNTLFRFLGVPILWVPMYSTDLASSSGAPLKWHLEWGGKLGPRLSLKYQAYTWRDWEAYLRLDARFRFGVAVGLETAHVTPDRFMQTLSYWARDASAVEKDLEWRYLFKGVFHQSWRGECTTLDLKYAKFSDVDMETDYYDRDFDFHNAGRTEAHLRSECGDWVANLRGRVRLNSFQTIKQELPVLDASFRPFEVGHTGILSFNRVNAGYFDYSYADNIEAPDFFATRVQCDHLLVWPWRLGCLRVVPEAGFTGVFYSHGPVGKSQDVHVGRLGVVGEVEAYRCYGCVKHVIRPYAGFRAFAGPGSSVDEHPIFDIEDGWSHLQYGTFGVANDWYRKTSWGVVHGGHVDIYGNIFVDVPSLPRHLPRVYVDYSWKISPCVATYGEVAWDVERERVTNLNTRLEWTIDEDLAFATEYRHRDEFYWRKVDYFNYMLESSRTEEELLSSPVTDRRDTWLFRAFYRFDPFWGVELRSRFGWGRFDEPSYLEYQADVYTILECAWKVRVSYQHKEHDDRVTLYVALGPKAPTRARHDLPTW